MASHRGGAACLVVEDVVDLLVAQPMGDDAQVLLRDAELAHHVVEAGLRLQGGVIRIAHELAWLDQQLQALDQRALRRSGQRDVARPLWPSRLAHPLVTVALSTASVDNSVRIQLRLR